MRRVGEGRVALQIYDDIGVWVKQIRSGQSAVTAGRQRSLCDHDGNIICLAMAENLIVICGHDVFRAQICRNFGRTADHAHTRNFGQWLTRETRRRHARRNNDQGLRHSQSPTAFSDRASQECCQPHPRERHSRFSV